MPSYHHQVVDIIGKIDPIVFKNAFQSLSNNNINNNNKNPTVIETIDQQPCPIIFPNVDNNQCNDIIEEVGQNGTINTPNNNVKAKKLQLVLDLDNTLVHAQSSVVFDNTKIDLEEFISSNGVCELYKFTLADSTTQYYVKLRPGVEEFLTELNMHYDLSIYTNATKQYADVILSILDPDRLFFGLRVVAREAESAKDTMKDIRKLFSADYDDKFLIVDDRKDVWDPTYHKNIFQCHYYDYYDSHKKAIKNRYGKNNNTVTFYPQEIMLRTNHKFVLIDHKNKLNLDKITMDGTDATDLLDNDRQLYFMKKILIETAEQYNNSANEFQPISLSKILQEKKKQILAGCVILMTGYHKAEQPSQYGMLDNGPLHMQKLHSMGATIVANPCSEVTHVVIIRQTISTDRAKSFCGDSIKFVHNLWIYACEQTWCKVDEAYFDAFKLLNIYFQPVLQPAQEHWNITKYYYNELIKNSNTSEFAKIEIASDSMANNIQSPDKYLNNVISDFAIDSSTKEEEEDLEEDENEDEDNVLLKAKAELIAKYKKYTTWPGSNKYSANSKLWSAFGETTIIYDPFILNLL